MTEAQFVTFLVAAPFLALSLAWLVGLSLIAPRAVRVKAKRGPANER